MNSKVSDSISAASDTDVKIRDADSSSESDFEVDPATELFEASTLYNTATTRSHRKAYARVFYITRKKLEKSGLNTEKILEDFEDLASREEFVKDRIAPDYDYRHSPFFLRYTFDFESKQETLFLLSKNLKEIVDNYDRLPDMPSDGDIIIFVSTRDCEKIGNIPGYGFYQKLDGIYYYDEKKGLIVPPETEDCKILSRCDTEEFIPRQFGRVVCENGCYNLCYYNCLRSPAPIDFSSVVWEENLDSMLEITCVYPRGKQFVLVKPFNHSHGYLLVDRTTKTEAVLFLKKNNNCYLQRYHVIELNKKVFEDVGIEKYRFGQIFLVE